jgi:hypothetical protein
MRPIKYFSGWGRSIARLHGRSLVVAVIKTKSSLTSNAVKGLRGVQHAALSLARFWGKYDPWPEI